jgi:elongation factor P
MDYLYSDTDGCYFMDPETFEQVSIPQASIGATSRFLKEGMKITVELLGEEPLTIQFPKVVALKVSTTGPGIRGGHDVSTMKPATLENDIEILVPQFVETGDTVRVDTGKIKYVDRMTVKKI